MFSNKYVIQEEIARGGMGVIYRALDLKLNRQVAIKVLHAHFSGDPAFAERFLREARAMARLDHENIIRIHAVEEQQGAHYIVMEYFPGANLRTLIRERGRLSVQDTLSISFQVAQALAYAHSHGIIHRDIKPANVMVDRCGKTKLADFGIAAAVDEASLTATGQIIGTPDYMSPEQAKGETLDGRSDLYSLGMLMYEMLVGATPYHAIPKTAILGKLLYDREDVTLQFPSNIPIFLQRIVSDLLRKEPQQRTSDASILANQLGDLLKTLPTSTSPADTDPTVIVAPSRTDSKTTRDSTIPLASGSLDPPASQVSRPPGKSVDLEETDILPPRRPVAARPEQPSWRTTLKTYHVVPWAAVIIVILISLVGLTYYLSMEPTRQTRNESPARDSQADAIQTAKKLEPDAEMPQAPDPAQIDEERRRLAEDQERLKEKRRTAEAEEAARMKEADAAALKEEDRKAAAVKAAERKSAEQKVAQQKKAEEDAQKERERVAAAKEAERQHAEQEAAERKKAEGEARRERERQVAAEQEAERLRAQREAAERKLKAEEEARRQQERIAGEKQAERLRVERETAERQKAEEEARKVREQLAAQKEAERLQAEQEAALRKKKAEEEARKEHERQIAAAKEAERRREQEVAARKQAEDEARKERERTAAVKEVERQRAERDASQRKEQEESRKNSSEEQRRQPKDQQIIAKSASSAGGTALLSLQTRQLQGLLEDFKKAYESQDMRQLQALSEMTQERQRNVEFMFSNYQTIRASIGKIVVTDDGATATMTLDEAVLNNGDRVKLKPIASTIHLKIPKDGNEWGKIMWP